MKNVLLLILGILFLIGCNKEFIDTNQNSNELKITANIAGMKTRATETNFQNGDVIQLYITEISKFDSNTIKDNNFISNTKKVNATYIDNNWVLETPIYYPKNVVDSCLRIKAVFNGDYAISDSCLVGNSKYMFSQPDSVTDFLYSYVEKCYNSSNPVELLFEHKLSKLKININDVDKIGINNWEVIISGINFNYSFDYKINTIFTNNYNDWEYGIIDSAVINNNWSYQDLIIPAQNIDSLTVVINTPEYYGVRKSKLFPNNLKTENGKITYLNINVKRNSVNIDSKILPWIEGEIYDQDFNF